MEYKEAENLILEGLRKEFPGHNILFSPTMKEQLMNNPEKEFKVIIFGNQFTQIRLYKEFIQDIIILKSIDPIPEIVALLSDQIRNKVKFN
jgi:hypothetical protein